MQGQGQGRREDVGEEGAGERRKAQRSEGARRGGAPTHHLIMIALEAAVRNTGPNWGPVGTSAPPRAAAATASSRLSMLRRVMHAMQMVRYFWWRSQKLFQATCSRT